MCVTSSRAIPDLSVESFSFLTLCSDLAIMTLASRSGNLASSESYQLFFSWLLDTSQTNFALFFVSVLSWNIVLPSGKENTRVWEQLVNENGQINIGTHSAIR